MIRIANVEDAKAIATINVQGWQTAYKGIFPDEFLDTIKLEERISGIEDFISSNPTQTFVFEIDQVIAGSVSFGPSRIKEFSQDKGEVYAIYVSLEHQKQGIGKALLLDAARALKNEDKSKMLVQVLEENHSATQFYQNLGGKQVGKSFFGDYPQLILAFDLAQF